MNFLTLDPALEAAIFNGFLPILIRIVLVLPDLTEIVVPHENIQSLETHSRYASTGVIITSSHLLFYQPEELASLKISDVKISFSCGGCGIFLDRFLFTPDSENLRFTREGGKKDLCCLHLEDLTARILNSDNLRDWTSDELIIESVVCNKETPERSLFHIIAMKAGTPPEAIDCVSIQLAVPYAKLVRSPWEELKDLTRAMHATLYAGTDKELILSESRYQLEAEYPEEIPTLDESLFYKLTEKLAGEKQYNDIRLKWNKPTRLPHQTLWAYGDDPTEYDASLNPSYPFSLNGIKREIETNPAYEAPYTAHLDGKEIKAVYADELSTQEEVETRIPTENDGIAITKYDTATYPDRAILTLGCTADDNLKNLTIEGRPLVVKANQACYRKDDESILNHGLKVLNQTGKYFLDAPINGTPHYEDWTNHTLETSKTLIRRFTGKSQYGLFYMRVGAKTYLSHQDGTQTLTKVENLFMTYNKKEGFEIKTTLLEINT